MKILTLGTFDLYHQGHVALLRRCMDLAGKDGQVIVGLNTDGFVERYKGTAPVIDYEGREACLRACRYVDAVVPNDQSDGSAQSVIEAVSPDLIAIGWDWHDRDYLAQLGVTRSWLDGKGVKVVYLPYTPGSAGSSSAIKSRIRSVA